MGEKGNKGRLPFIRYQRMTEMRKLDVLLDQDFSFTLYMQLIIKPSSIFTTRDKIPAVFSPKKNKVLFTYKTIIFIFKFKNDIKRQRKKLKIISYPTT